MSNVIRFRRRRRRRSSLAPPPSRWRVLRLAPLAVLIGGVAGYLLFDLLSPVPPVAADARRAAESPIEPIVIAGQASVIDGDTLEVHGTRIRLHGIDAPESDQLCRVQKREMRCGQLAALALSDRVGRSTVTCEPRDRDRYGRIVAVCRERDQDLNAWMVAEGWAMAYREYSRDYIPQEQIASAARIGIWAGEFVAPWKWRRGERLSASVAQQAGECAVKGNIGSKGERIYHVPGGEFYERTKIDRVSGERWFCTEAEAQAAGWRRSKR